jgi:hypothetical protein
MYEEYEIRYEKGLLETRKLPDGAWFVIQDKGIATEYLKLSAQLAAKDKEIERLREENKELTFFIENHFDDIEDDVNDMMKLLESFDDSFDEIKNETDEEQALKEKP